MATLVLAAAGAALGSAVGGTVAGIAAPVIGRALGGLAGSLIDQALLGGGARVVETGRIDALRLQGSREGTALPRVFGRMRVAGTVIWAARFREWVDETGTGGKGAPRQTVRSHRYTVSLALALCEGVVTRIGRLWADGREIAVEDLPLRLHRGTADQPPDPLIAALEPLAPAFRGTAYLVFEDLDLAPFGNRVPQFGVEVFREPVADPALAGPLAPPLRDLVTGVALSPGSGEFSLDTEPVLRRLGPGEAVWENVHGIEPRADLLLSLDQLAEELPAVRDVLLVTSWFGDDLRAGHCTLRPGVETADKTTEPHPWTGGGVDRAAARLVGQREGRPVYGGTPSDRGVGQAIRAMRGRGLRVVFYPFILMDIPPGNGVPDPYGGAAQAAYPWRGRITGAQAPGAGGAPPWDAANAAAVAAFFGAAAPGDFVREGDAVRYTGPAEWSLRRMVLHYAHQCAAAGGVDAFCIASELRGLTTLRDAPDGFPAVAALRALARDVRTVLGPGPRIGYAADWSEYFGFHPADGSGDVFFHLDPLWADPAIDFVGIDNYLPLADWRDGPDHLDAALADSIHDLGYLRGNVEGGEYFDWFYASDDDRRAQRRTPIADGAHGEPWVFRAKDIRGWWANAHHERVGGVRRATPTAWVPGSKPVWFTEIGCAAVDKGANQPNVFLDAKSAESALPWFSTGAPDAHGQRRFLQAALGHWAETGAPMLGRVMVWTWDARRWPDFPARQAVWADGANHRAGHWITGRLGAAGLAETVAEICAAAGVGAVDVSALEGVVEGYALDRIGTGRAALQPLMLAYGFDAVETAGVLRFVPRGRGAVASLAPGDLVAAREGAALTLVRAPEAVAALRLGFIDAEADYGAAVAASPGAAATGQRVEAMELPLALTRGAAQAAVAGFLAAAEAARDTARFALPPARLALEPGDVVALDGALWRIDRLGWTGALSVEAARVAPLPRRGPEAAAAPPMPPAPPAPPEAVLMDLPDTGAGAGPRLAVFARPWTGPVAVWAGQDPLRWLGTVERPATLGHVLDPVPGAVAGRWWRGAVRVRLAGGALAAAATGAVLDGANLAAVEAAPGQWEVIQFAGAVLEAPGVWRLGPLLRGQAGTEALAAAGWAAGARFVRLDGAPAALPLPPLVPETLRVVPGGAAVDHPGALVLAVAPTGAWARPFAPCHPRLHRTPDALTVTWLPRNPRDDDRWTGDDTAAAAAWRVRLHDGARLLREAVTDTPAFVWTAAEQAADAPAGPVRLAVAQLSPAVGAGPELEVTIDG